MNRYVYHSGPLDADIMLIGESPGRMESVRGKPFAGPSGAELRTYLQHCSPTGKLYHPADIYITNVRKEYFEDNHDPTEDEIAHWIEILLEEIETVQPKVIICAGRYAAWELLGGRYKYPMRMIHGRPCYGGEFDSSYASRAQSAIVVPVYHPAAGLHNDRMKSTIWADFESALRVHEALEECCNNDSDDWQLDLAKQQLNIPTDEHKGNERYLDVSGSELKDYLKIKYGSPIAIDTEDGPRGKPWSLQVCHTAGYAVTLRRDTIDYNIGISALQSYLDNGAACIMHFAMHDYPVLRSMGINTDNINISDTANSSYVTAESQSLKHLAWRLCGMFMSSFSDMISIVDTDRQLAYLEKVSALNLSTPPKNQVLLNNAEEVSYGPISLSVTANRIIADIKNGKRDKDGNPVDALKRWTGDTADAAEKRRYKRELRLEVEQTLGGCMPTATIDDVYKIDPKRAIDYACRDADATLRVDNALCQIDKEINQ